MKIPFDDEKLSTLMQEAGMDLVLATSKENVQYLLGGFRFFFFAHKDAIGASRYLPVLGIPCKDFQKSFYIGNPGESWQQAAEPIWVQNVKNNQWFSDRAGKDAANFIRQLDLAKGTVAVEKCFIPADTLCALQEEFPQTRFVDALPILEELRAVKRPDELVTINEATEQIIESMLTVMRSTKVGTTTREIAHRLHLEEIRRGLNFEYCLITAGPNFNRAPSDARWEKGDILSLDSGGNKDGYVGDLCRMAVMGEPTPLMRDLLAEVRAVQAAARTGVKAGILGGEIYEKALGEQARCPHGDQMAFLAHGMGIIQHELPRLTNSGPIPYTATHANSPLDAGMVLSIETDLKNKEVGFVKLEDTVVVTKDGWEAYGDKGRDWVIVEE